MSEYFVLAFMMIVVGIPVIGSYASKAYTQRLALRERELELIGSQTAEKAAQYAVRTEQLEQRLAVLERIATDQPNALAREIDALAVAHQPKKDLA